MGLAFAFEGCGCRAAFHAGAVARLDELGVRAEGASGASSGSLIAAAVGLGIDDVAASWGRLLGRARAFEPRRLLRLRWPGVMSDVLAGALAESVGDVRLPDLPREVAIVVTQIGLGGPVRRVLTRSDDVAVAHAVLASSFFPGPYARIVPIDGRPTVDGAWHVRTPVAEARALAAHVVAFVTRPDGRLRYGLFLERALTLPPFARVLAPAEPLALGSFDFDPERTREAFSAGRRAAEAFARREEAWLGEVLSGALGASPGAWT